MKVIGFLLILTAIALITLGITAFLEASKRLTILANPQGTFHINCEAKGGVLVRGDSESGWVCIPGIM